MLLLQQALLLLFLLQLSAILPDKQINHTQEQSIFYADARLLPIWTFQLEHASETDHTATMQCNTKSATKTYKERERAQCACMTGTINFLLQLYYNRDSLLWEISISCCCWSCAAAAVAVVVALLFFLLCAYNSWFTARSYCSWLCATMQHIEIFIYQHIY